MKGLLPWLRGATAAATLLLAVLLCWQCIDIYATGNAADNLDENGVHLAPVYTMEDVTSRLATLAVPAAVWALLAGATAVVQSRVPQKQSRQSLTAENRLRLLRSRVTQLPEEALREERLRRKVWLAAAAVLLLCAGMAGLFLFNGKNFVSWDLERVMGALLVHVAPWAAVALLAVFAALCLCGRSCERECEALRGMAAVKAAPVQKKSCPVNVLRICLYLAAIVFIVLGVMNGGIYDVLIKAINICTECIGLG